MRLNIFKSRDKPRNSAPGQSYGFLFGGTSSGKSVVNERSAMQMTAVYVCVRILSEATAGLPLHLYRCWRPLILTKKCSPKSTNLEFTDFNRCRKAADESFFNDSGIIRIA